eukprot:15089475-Alexandrium_andersonii.AAC.1
MLCQRQRPRRLQHRSHRCAATADRAAPLAEHGEKTAAIPSAAAAAAVVATPPPHLLWPGGMLLSSRVAESVRTSIGSSSSR